MIRLACSVYVAGAVCVVFAGCDFPGFCSSGEVSPNEIASVVSISARSPYGVQGGTGVVFGTNYGRPLTIGNSSGLSVRRDRRALAVNTGYQAPEIYTEREGYTSLPDSLSTCLFSPIGDKLTCASAAADTIATGGGSIIVQSARTSVAEVSISGELGRILFSDSAVWLRGDKYRITTYANPAFSSDGAWMAVWSQRETRKLVRNAADSVVEDIRFAADSPEVLLLNMVSGEERRVTVPLMPGPYDPTPTVAVSRTGEQVAVISQGRVIVMLASTGELIVSLEGRAGIFSPSGEWIATLPNAAHQPVRIASLEAGGSARAYALTLPAGPQAFTFAQQEDRLFVSTVSGVFTVVAGESSFVQGTRFDDMKAILERGSGSTASSGILAVFTVPELPETVQILAGYWLYPPDPCG